MVYKERAVPTRQVNLYEAKTHLSALLEEAAAGTDIIIAKAGRPVGKLVAVEERGPREPGLYKDRIEVLEDFDAPLPETLMRGFLGENG